MVKLPTLQRARAIGHLEAGWKQRDVAVLFGVSQSTICKLCRRYRDTNDVKDRHRSGRPRITTERVDRLIRLATLRNRRITAHSLQMRYLGCHGRRVSVQTIRNRLHSFQLNSRNASQKPLLTVRHRHSRLRWCRVHRIWNQRMWAKVLFSDESRFCLRSVDGRVRVWRRRGERFAESCIDRKVPFGGGSVMIWGGISTGGKTDLIHVAGNLNGQRYLNEVLNPVAIPYIRTLGAGGTLQDDNARPHGARLVNDHLTQQRIPWMDWPANSPDLNPIEHLWDQLGRAVNVHITQQSTLADLRRFLTEEWNAAPQVRIQRLIANMRRRWQAVINAYGGSTRY